MRAIIADVRRGCRIVSCLLAAFAAFAASQSAQAAWNWNGNGATTSWDDVGNWGGNHSGHHWIPDVAEGKRLCTITNNVSDGYQTHLYCGTEEKPFVLQNSGTFTAGTQFDIGDNGNGAAVFQGGEFVIGTFFVGNPNLATPYTGYLKLDNTTLTLNADGKLNRGKLVSVDSTLTMASGKSFIVGAATNSTAVVDKTSGNWDIQKFLDLASAADSTAYVTNSGGSIVVHNYVRVGCCQAAEGPVNAHLEIAGGAVSNVSYHLSISDYATPGSVCSVRVSGNAEYYSAGGIYVGQRQHGTSTLTVDGGLVTAKSNGITFSNVAGEYTEGATCAVYLNGGTIAAPTVKYGSGAAPSQFVFNGGTLQATAGGTLVAANDKLAVKVCSGGGTIDANGKDVVIDEPLLEDGSSQGGGMKYVGGGRVSLSGDNTYTGTTTVEVGTTLVVSALSDLGGGLAISVPETTPADGVYVLVAIDGSGTFEGYTLPAAPVGATIRLSGDKKSVLCMYGSDLGPVWIGGASGSLSDTANWADNAVPGAGTNCVIDSVTPATLTVGDTFAASSITFPADSAAITINAANDESISGIAAVTNLSTASSHTINVPVHFTGDIQVKQAADHYDHRAEPHIIFAGGAYAGAGGSIETGSTVNWSRCIFGEYSLGNTEDSRLTAPVYSNCRPAVTDNSTLYIPYAGKLTELYVGAGAKVFIGDMALDGRLLYQNYGEVVVTNMTVTGSSDVFVSYNQGTTTPGVFKFESVTNSLSSKWFYLSDYNAISENVFYIGAGGLNFTSDTASYCLGNKKGTDNLDTIRPWYSDFTIADGGNEYNVAFNYGATFCTDDEDGIGRTITIASGTRAAYASPVVVSGSGTLKVNKPCQNVVQPQVVVTDTATLEYASGASLGTGPLTLGAGTTFVVASADLPINVASLTLPESGTATIHITGNAALADDDYAVLFSAAGLPTGFADKINLVLPDGTSESRQLYTTDNGTMRLFVGEGDLPYTWTGAANDGKMNTVGNWLAGAIPPAGAAVFILPSAGEIVNDIENFAPASITIGYGTDSLKIVGNAMTVGVVTNCSSSAVNPELACRVDFAGTYRVHNETQPVNFSGGAYATCPDSGNTDNAPSHALMGEIHLTSAWNCDYALSNPYTVPNGSRLYGQSLDGTRTQMVLTVEEGGYAEFAGNVYTGPNCGRVHVYGEMAVKGRWIMKNTGASGHVGFDGDENGNGIVRAKGIWKGDADHDMSRSCYIKPKHIYVGSDGLGAKTDDYSIHFDAGPRTVYAMEDFEVFGVRNENNLTDWGVSLQTQTTFDTQGHKITWTAGTNGKGAFVKAGEGTLEFNPYGVSWTNTVTVSGGTLVCAMSGGMGSGAITVEANATLAVNSGAKTGTGAVTVKNGGTLAAAESGTATVGGNLTFKAGAMLGFNYTNRNEPVLDLTNKTVTFDEGAATNVIVKISADVGKWAKCGLNVLTSGGKFADATVSLAPGAPDWVNGISVVDGEIVLDVKPMGTILIVR